MIAGIWHLAWLWRVVLAGLSGFVITLFVMPRFIHLIQAGGFGQVVRDDGPRSHLNKTGTPSMGGVVFVLATLIAVLLFGRLDQWTCWLPAMVLLLNAAVGFIDDYRKVILKSPRGLPGRYKLLCQGLIALLVGGFLYFSPSLLWQAELWLPGWQLFVLPMGAFFILWVMLVMVGSSNAVNLTDGVDGLATHLVLLVLLVMIVMLLTVSHGHYFSAAMGVLDLSESVVFVAALMGSLLGFLWFNAYPARIFMGDVGSLALGATLGLLAVMMHQSLLWVLLGGVFVAETVSVILQVGSYKLTRRRIFRMAPLHHHFELLGWGETQVVTRFVVVGWILAGLSLAIFFN